jgi:hypothetical protein
MGKNHESDIAIAHLLMGKFPTNEHWPQTADPTIGWRRHGV